MNKIIIPLLMLMTFSLSGCVYDPFFRDHGHGRGWGHGGDWDRDGGHHHHHED